MVDRRARELWSLGPVGATGAVDQVVALPGDRAIAARQAPPQLLDVHLGGGAPTWTDGPGLGSRVTAMAVSPDATLLVTARPTTTGASELALFGVDSGIVFLDTIPVAGDVTAIAISPPQ